LLGYKEMGWQEVLLELFSMKQTELEEQVEEILKENSLCEVDKFSECCDTGGIKKAVQELSQLLTPQVEMGDTLEKSMLRYIWNDSIFNKITRKLEVGEKPYQELKEYHFPTNKGDKG